MFLELDGGFLLLRGSHSFLLVGKVISGLGLCIEVPEGEYVQGLSPGDLVAASAPEGGPLEPARMLIDLVRVYRMPLIVLPKDHPGSRRLRIVISAGPVIELNCGIRRGTHPEQHLICSSDELAGIVLRGVPGGIEVSNIPDAISFETIPPTI
ncbi:MAG: alpha/beta hydrolase [Methanoregulaceae archaeon]